jgi:hypothetical protein
MDGLVKGASRLKIGVDFLLNGLKWLDSGFGRNDGKWWFSTFYEFIKVQIPRDI